MSQDQIDAFIAAHGVTKCPPGVAVGVILTDDIYGQFFAYNSERMSPKGALILADNDLHWTTVPTEDLNETSQVPV